MLGVPTLEITCRIIQGLPRSPLPGAPSADPAFFAWLVLPSDDWLTKSSFRLGNCLPPTGSLSCNRLVSYCLPSTAADCECLVKNDLGTKRRTDACIHPCA